MGTFGLSDQHERLLYLVVNYLRNTVFVGLNDVIKHTDGSLMWQAEESAGAKKFQLRDASATSKRGVNLMRPMMFRNAHTRAQNNWRKRAHFAHRSNNRFAYEKIFAANASAKLCNRVQKNFVARKKYVTGAHDLRMGPRKSPRLKCTRA
tara:strand:+ start:1158 stop:1607 length:450 start_codon:yes stop_codon:yes gene_type:complete